MPPPLSCSRVELFNHYQTHCISLPHVLKPKILNICHMSHFDIKNTYKKLLVKFYWSGILKDTKNFPLDLRISPTQGSFEQINVSIEYHSPKRLQFSTGIDDLQESIHHCCSFLYGYLPAFLHFGWSLSNIFDLFEYPKLCCTLLSTQICLLWNKCTTENVNNMKRVQHLHNQWQNKFAKLCKFQINDIISSEPKALLNPETIAQHFTIKRVFPAFSHDY